MGILVVLAFWIVILLGLGKLGSVILRTIVRSMTQGLGAGRDDVIRLSGRFPYFCLAWLAVAFIFQAYVNTAVFHNDIGIGDSFETRLPNGYALLLIDNLDNGYVYNPMTQPGAGVGPQDDAVASVTLVQVADLYVLGGVAERSTGLSPGDLPTSYFLLDTRAGKHQNFADIGALRDAARRLGIQVALEPIGEIYARYRFNWFQMLFMAILFLPPAAAFILLARRIFQLRKTDLLAKASV